MGLTLLIILGKLGETLYIYIYILIITLKQSILRFFPLPSMGVMNNFAHGWRIRRILCIHWKGWTDLISGASLFWGSSHFEARIVCNISKMFYIYIYIVYVRHIFVYDIICLSYFILIAPSFLLQIFRNRLRPAWISPWAKWTNWSLGATRPWKGEPPVSWNMATKNSPFRDGKSPMIYRWFMGFNGLYCNVNHVFCWVNGTSDVPGYHAPKQHRPGESLLFRGN